MLKSEGLVGNTRRWNNGMYGRSFVTLPFYAHFDVPRGPLIPMLNIDVALGDVVTVGKFWHV